MNDRTPQKIAVLGGGMGALSAVYWLTSQPGWQERYSITVYQLGWRLGGKGATGRNLRLHDRIEEHGYHLLFGFYENTFKMLRACFAELGRDPSLPISELIAPTAADELAHPDRYGLWRSHHFIAQQELAGGEWNSFVVDFPENTDLPGSGGDLPSPLAYLEMALEMLHRLVTKVGDARAAAPPPGGAPSLRERLPEDARRVLGELAVDAARAFSFADHLDLARKLIRRLVDGEQPREERLNLLVEILRAQLRVLWAVIGADVPKDWSAYLLWTAADFLSTLVVGFIEDDLATRGLDSINDLNFWEWIARHGTVAEGTYITNASFWIQGAYDASFAFVGGDTTSPRRPDKPVLGEASMEAGTLLRDALRLMLTYKGAPAWRFQTGTAEVLFAPLYQVLERRGVRFEFFQKVENLGLGAGGRSIETIRIQEQVRLADPQSGYRPLVPVRQVPCWPSEPLWDQIRDADSVRGHNLESFWTSWQGVGTRLLRQGQDFDLVLLAIPVGSLPTICPELIAKDPAWARMVEHVLTVRTEGIQTGLTEDLQSLGWTEPEGPVGLGVEPLDTWADMTQLLQRESWPPGEAPRGLSFFVSAMRDDPGQPPPPDPRYPPTQTERVAGDAVHLFETSAGHFWPNATGAGGFRWDVLQAPPALVGPARLEAQYLRANIDPNERYVLSVPGSSVHRLASGASGFDNLYLAGDWVYTGLNAGCMECAVMGGMQASRAISGYPPQIYGEKDFGRARPRRSAAVLTGEPRPIVLTLGAPVRSSPAEEDPRRATEDRIAALGLVALTALPAALVAVPAAAAIWIFCGQWTSGYHRVQKILRGPLELAKGAVRHNTDNLTPAERQQLDGLLRKV